MYKQTGTNLVSYFVDDDKKILRKKSINGVKILSFHELILLSKQKTINNIIIAILLYHYKIEYTCKQVNIYYFKCIIHKLKFFW